MIITAFVPYALNPLMKYLEKKGHSILYNEFNSEVDIIICGGISQIYKVLKIWKFIKKNKVKLVNIILDIPLWKLDNNYKYNKFWWYAKQDLYHFIYIQIHKFQYLKRILNKFKSIINRNNSNKKINNIRTNSVDFYGKPFGYSNPISILYFKINKDPYNKISYYKHYRDLLKKSDLNLSISKFTQKCLKKYLNINSNVWYPCVDSDLLTTIPKNLDIKFDAINVSRILPHKHQKIFEAAAKKLGLKIVIIGIHQDVSIKLEYPHYCLPFHNDLFKAIVQSRMYVDPSSFEGFGMTPVEATFLNKPVIASDIYVHKEVLKDYPLYFKTGDVNDLADKMQLIKDGNYSINTKTANYIKHKYSVDNSGKHFLNFLETIK